MTVFTDKAKVYVPRLMKDLTIKDFQSEGIFGNIGGETGGFVALQEKKPIVAGSAGGFGWLMWTGPRRRKYTLWCKAQNMDPSSDEANYQYLVKETLTDEAHSLAQLKKTTTLEAATETFMLQNLRPGIPNLKGRIDWAKKAKVAQDTVVTPTPSKVGSAIVVATTGAVVASQVHPTHPHLWPWIIGVTAVVGILGWIIIHAYRKKTNA